MRIPLKLVPESAASHDADAWFVPGCDARTWFDEIQNWDVVLDSIQLRAVPRSFDDRTPLGILVTAGAPSEHDGIPAPDLRPPEESGWVDFVGSVRLGDGSLRLFPLAGDIKDYLMGGPPLAESTASQPGLVTVP